MRVISRLACQSILIASVVPLASAQDTIPTVIIPDAYIVGKAPPGITGPEYPTESAKEKKAFAGEKPAAVEREGAAALNGTLYAVVAPIYDGSNVTSSFIRLINGGSTTSTFSVTVVGSPSSISYGTATIQVPTRAAPQYSLSQILNLAGAGSLTGGDTQYALYIQNSNTAAGYQHVIFNSNNSFFENASICKRTFNKAVSTVSNSVVLPNVHTSLLGPWPSQVEIHNFWNATVTYRVTVVESASGSVMGQVNVPITANTTYSMPFTFFEQQIGWTPMSGESHANVVITDTSGAVPNIVAGHSILNDALSANINMTMACAVNDPIDSGLGGGFGDGGFTY